MSDEFKHYYLYKKNPISCNLRDAIVSKLNTLKKVAKYNKI
tara:strand:- start:3307 stop:3429 length:123 start_codon:yes stop_codon:yes gene_type:complete